MPTDQTTDRPATTDLIYDKWGTRVAVCDEADEGLQRFVSDGAAKTATSRGWEILPGPVERVPDGVHDGDEVTVYLWPVVRATAAGEAVSGRG